VEEQQRFYVRRLKEDNFKLAKKSEMQLQEQEMLYEDLRSYYFRYHDMVVETLENLDSANNKIEEFGLRERGL